MRLDMRTDIPLVLSSETPASEIPARLSVVGDLTPVVVVRQSEAGASYFVFRAHDLLALVTSGSGALLRDRARLDLRAATPALDVDDVADPPVGAVLLSGTRVLAVVEADGAPAAPRARPSPQPNMPPYGDGLPLPPQESPPPGPWPPPSAGQVPHTAEGGAVGRVWRWVLRKGGAISTANYRLDQPTGGATPQEPPAPAVHEDRRLFKQFPHLAAPREVMPDERFVLSVGFTAQRPVGADPSVIRLFVPNAPPRLTFTVQVAGFGFTFPSGIRRELTVDRDDPSETVEIDVVADSIGVAAPRILEVSYEYAGVVVGEAWAEVTVVPLGLPLEGAAPVAGTGVRLPEEVLAGPHLTVDIRSQVGGPVVEWVFHPRYSDVPRPGYRVTTHLAEHSAQTFAATVMNDIPRATGSPLLPLKLQGTGAQIADVMPTELWDVLAATWARARAAGERPTLLINSDEAFVAWELAWVDASRVDPALLDGTDGGHLGCLWDVGRWVPALNPRARDPRPVSPPPDLIEVDQIAVVTGHYDVDALPWAVREGEALAQRYDGVQVSADEQEVAALLAGTLMRDGSPVSPSLVHIAAHGEVDPANVEFTGIVLTSGRHLDPLTLRASRMVRDGRPFLFVNACQVGTASKVLNTYSGLSGAFLSQGARGFVAPLWYVDDEPAHDLALEFYRRTLEEGDTVSAAVREMRCRYVPGVSDSPTPLAYVFYGSPLLRLTRTAHRAGPDNATTAAGDV